MKSKAIFGILIIVAILVGVIFAVNLKTNEEENSLEKDNDSNFPVIDIIVSNTYLKLVYYHDILRYGFMNMSTLPDSQAIVVPNALYIVWIENGRLTS